MKFDSKDLVLMLASAKLARMPEPNESTGDLESVLTKCIDSAMKEIGGMSLSVNEPPDVVTFRNTAASGPANRVAMRASAPPQPVMRHPSNKYPKAQPRVIPNPRAAAARQGIQQSFSALSSNRPNNDGIPVAIPVPQWLRDKVLRETGELLPAVVVPKVIRQAQPGFEVDERGMVKPISPNLNTEESPIE